MPRACFAAKPRCCGSPARADYEYAFLGKAREVLAKAEAAAGARGVPCESRHVASDKPAQAIVEAARERGCDLIFMASHGGRGRWAWPSRPRRCRC